MATISLYTQPNEEGLQQFTMGTFTTQNLEKGIDYTEDYLEQVEAQSIGGQVYALHLTLGLGALNNIEVDQANSPVPIVRLKQIEDLTDTFAPANCDIHAPYLETQPEDWALGWRYKYNKTEIRQLDNGQWLYTSGGNYPPTSGGSAYALPFEPGTYRETNQGRYLFWTGNGAYFGIQAQWLSIQPAATRFQVYRVQAFAAQNDYQYDIAATEAAVAYVNAIRERGVQSDFLPVNKSKFMSGVQANPGTVAENLAPNVFCNFIQFSYPIELPGGEIIDEEMVGIAVWQESTEDHIIQSGVQISALSRRFWIGKDKPAYSGPTSGVAGGQGRFRRGTTTRGDHSGETAAGIVNRSNAAFSAIDSGYNKYIIGPDDDRSQSAFSYFLRNFLKPNIVEDWININYNPASSIIQCHQMPNSLVPGGIYTSKVITAAGIELSQGGLCATFEGHSASKHIGTVVLRDNAGAGLSNSSSFADFANTQIIINLPYIGVQTIDVSSCMGGVLSIDYMSDVWSGDVTAIVTVTDMTLPEGGGGSTAIRYAWKGNCARQVPIQTYTSPQHSFAMGVAKTGANAFLAITGGAIGGAIAGANQAGAIASRAIARSGKYVGPTAQEMISMGARQGATQGLATGISTLGNELAAVTGANSTLSSNASFGQYTSPIDTVPWVLIVRPEWSNPERYARECGYPSDRGGVVSDFHGLLITSSIELDGIKCTDDERSEIANYMAQGVYLDGTTGQ